MVPHKQAFTLIELLVVVLIIGILAAVAVPQYQKAVIKSRAAEALSMLKAIEQAQETYYLANGEYSTDMTGLDIGIIDSKMGTWTENKKAVFVENSYTYFCYDNSNGQNTYCAGVAGNADWPSFEIALAHNVSSNKKYKIRCRVAASENKSTLAKSICKGMGTEYSPGYYVINY